MRPLFDLVSAYSDRLDALCLADVWIYEELSQAEICNWSGLISAIRSKFTLSVLIVCKVAKIAASSIISHLSIMLLPLTSLFSKIIGDFGMIMRNLFLSGHYWQGIRLKLLLEMTRSTFLVVWRLLNLVLLTERFA